MRIADIDARDRAGSGGAGDLGGVKSNQSVMRAGRPVYTREGLPARVLQGGSSAAAQERHDERHRSDAASIGCVASLPPA
jgi:hypothetical protein